MHDENEQDFLGTVASIEGQAGMASTVHRLSFLTLLIR
jgi:hypothetical protein